MLGAVVKRLDVAKETADEFGPLKIILGAVSAGYTNHEVRSRPPAQFFI